MAKKRAGTSAATNRERARSTPALLPLGFASLPPLAAFLLFAAVLFIAPFLFSGFWPSSYEYWPQALFLAVCACTCLLLALAPRDTSTNKAPLVWLMGAFALWCVLSIFGTAYLHDSLLELARVLGVVSCFYIGRHLLSHQEYLAPRTLWLLAAVTAGITAVSLPALWDFAVTRNPRQFGTFYNPNLFANYCAMALPLTAAGVLVWRQRAREHATAITALGFGVLAIIGLGLVVTSSKGGWLAAFCGLIVFAAALLRAKGERVRRVLRARKTVVAIIALLLIAGAGVLFSQTILPRISTNLESDHSTMFRVYTWAGTWRMAEARPLTGWGAGSFPSAYTQFAETGYTRSAHQSWLQIAAENGFPAMLLLLAAGGFACARAWKLLQSPSWPIAAGGLGAIVAFAIHGLTDSGWNVISVAMLLMLVLAMVSSAECGVRSAELSAEPRRSSLNWPWLVTALVLALGSWLTQRAQTGEDLRRESRELMARGAVGMAVEKAQLAVDTNPYSARLVHNYIQSREAAGQEADMLYRVLLRLQPTRALNHLYYAESSKVDKASKEMLFENAVSLDPNDTDIRMSRGKWKLSRDDKTGWHDILYLAELKDKPYGKYPATPEMVDLNYGRAFVMLAGQSGSGNPQLTKRRIARGLEVIAEARLHEPQRRQLEQATLGSIDYSRERTMDELEAKLKSLQEKLK